MKKQWLLPAAAVALIAIAAMNVGRLRAMLPANARCLNCRRDFNVPSGVIQCNVCRHVMHSDLAKALFNCPPGVPHLIAPTKRHDGPTLPDVTVIQ